MAFKFTNLEQYYSKNKAGKEAVNNQTAHDYTTTGPVNNQTSHNYTTAILKPKMAGQAFTTQTVAIHNISSPSDRKSIFSFNGSKGTTNHMNNYDTGYLNVSPNPDKRDGTSAFEFSETMPNGGASYQTYTRLKYNSHFADPGTAAKKNKLSDTQLVDVYHKRVNGTDFVDLRSEAERNNMQSSLWLRAPFVQRGMQRGEDNPKGPLERINMLTAPVIDTVRVVKFLGSPKGLLFMAKQVGLQLTNPKGEFLSAFHSSRIFNPLAFALQIPLTQFGVHIDRHFLGPANTLKSNYEDRVFQKNKLQDGEQNRLVQLSTLDIENGMEIPMLSGIMGPHSFFGIGKTTIFKHTSGAPISLRGAILNKLSAAIPFAGGLAAASQFSSALTEGGEDESGTPNLQGHLEASASTLFDGYTKTMANAGTNEGDSDPSGVNDGFYMTSNYDQLSQGIGNDLKTSKYGSPEALSKDTAFEQSKFGLNEAIEPSALTNDGRDLLVNFQPAEGPIDPSGKIPGTYKTTTYEQKKEEHGNDLVADGIYGPSSRQGTFSGSKFAEDSDIMGAPTAIKNDGGKLFVKSPANSGEVALGRPIQKFDVFSYMDMDKFRKQPSISFRDFRTKDPDDSYEGNLIATRNLKEYGKTATHEYGTNTFDQVTSTDPDVVKVMIGDVWFRAYINDFTDKLTTGYSEVSYTGIATKGKQYDNISRAWTLDIAMPAFTALDLQYNYKRLNAIMQLAAPKTSGEHAGGQLTTITVGDLWIEMPTILTSVDYDVNNDIGWDIGISGLEEQITAMKTTSTKILPMYFDLKLGGDFLGDVDGSVWNSTSNFFAESNWSDIT